MATVPYLPVSTVLMPYTLTHEDIHTYGTKARQSVPQITQNCGEIIDAFEGFLNDYAGLPWSDEYADRYGRVQIRVGPNGEEKHYIFTIDSELVEGFDSGGEVWIDLSFDQFNTQNYENGIIDVSYGDESTLDAIKIIGPNAPEQSGDGPYQFGFTM